MYKLNKLLFAVLLAPCLSYGAAAAPFPSLPENLMYQGSPIPATCFINQEEMTGTISLRNCTQITQNNYQMLKSQQALLDKGFIGSDYQDKRFPGSAIQPYAYYKWIGSAADGDVIEIISNGGGSGTFTTLELIKRKSDEISYQVISTGDRCHGGIQGASVLGSSLQYHSRLTPAAILGLANDFGYHIDSSSASDAAVDCAATATYEVSLNNLAKKELTSIDFSSGPGLHAGLFSKNYCLSHLKTNYLEKGKTKLTKEEFREALRACSK